MISPGQVVATKLWLYFIALAAVLTRLYVRLQQRHFTGSEIFLLLSITLYTIEEAIGVALWRSGFFSLPMEDFMIGGFPSLESEIADKNQLSKILELYFFSSTLTFLVFWATKGAFIMMYYQLVPRTLRKVRIALHGAAFLVTITFIGFLATSVLGCGNISRNWSTNPATLCFSFNSKISVVCLAVVHLGTDILIYVLPFFLLPHLQLPRRHLFGIAAMFALGIAVVGCILARCGAAFAHGHMSMREMMTWDSGEMTLGILVACSPCFKWLWIKTRNITTLSGVSKGAWFRSTSTGGLLSRDGAPEHIEGRKSGLLIMVRHTIDVKGLGDTVLSSEDVEKGRTQSIIIAAEQGPGETGEGEGGTSWLDDSRSVLTVSRADSISTQAGRHWKNKFVTRPIPAVVRL